MADVHPTGEEWRALEQTDEVYRPQRWDSQVAAARQAIPARRMRAVRLRLRDRRGRPLAGRRVELAQTIGDFQWGFCGWGLVEQLRDGVFDAPEHAERRRWLTGLYDAVNIMHYWTERSPRAPQSERHLGELDYDPVERCVDWANAHGLVAKGHPLFWPVPKAIPGWMARYDQATRRAFLEVRVRSLTARMKGRMRVYDAVNEMLWEPALRNTASRHWPHLEDLDAVADDAADVLRWARAEDPDACYLLNEYGIDHGSHEDVGVAANDGSRVTRHGQLQRYVALLARLAERGALPDAVGVQTPHGPWSFHLGSQEATCTALGEASGLPVHITEYRQGLEPWLKAGIPRPEALERFAEYLEHYLTCAFAHPHVEAFYTWGDLEMFQDGLPTLVYHRVRTLLRERWRTRLDAVTDADGVIAFDGFTGAYVARFARGPGHSGAERFVVRRGTGIDAIEVMVPG